MKFMLSAVREREGCRWTFYLPRSFSIKRLGASFDVSTGVLTLWSDPDGCKVINTYKSQGKRVQIAAKKWLPDLGGDRIEPIEVEWKNGELQAQVRPPVRSVKRVCDPLIVERKYQNPLEALKILNEYVSDPDNNAEFDLSDPKHLRIKITKVSWL